MKYRILIFITFIFCTSIFAQSDSIAVLDSNFFTKIESDTLGGKITIIQDTSIQKLVVLDIELNEKSNGVIEGYRIQLISLSGRTAREEMNYFKDKFITLYPEFDQDQIYTLYHPPFFKVRVGNYRDKFGALKFYKELVKHFPNAYLVKGPVEFPKLD